MSKFLRMTVVATLALAVVSTAQAQRARTTERDSAKVTRAYTWPLAVVAPALELAQVAISSSGYAIASIDMATLMYQVGPAFQSAEMAFAQVEPALAMIEPLTIAGIEIASASLAYAQPMISAVMPMAAQAAAYAVAPLAIALDWDDDWDDERDVEVPEGWAPQDPADSVWRQARRSLNSRQYEEAADLFRDLRRRFPRSTYVADAYYWEAFALSRRENEDDIERALELVDTQISRYPDARTRREARDLSARLRSWLAARGDADRAQELVREAESAQGADCDDEDDDLRQTAMRALLNMRSADAGPILERVLANKDECNAKMRRMAVQILAQQRRIEGREEILLDVARNDPNREVRRQAVFWLSQVNSEAAVEALELILESEEDADMHERAIFALSQNRSQRASEILRDYAERGECTEIRGKAIFWLGQRRGSGEYLRSIYPTLPCEDLKKKGPGVTGRCPTGSDRWPV